MELRKMFDIEVFNKDTLVRIKGRYIFGANLVFLLIIYGMLIKKHFSSDTYNILFQTSTYGHLKLGRIVGYVIALFFDKMHINQSAEQSYFTILFIVTLAVLITIMVKAFCSKIQNLNLKKVVLINICLFISFVNVYILEWFFFPESLLNFAIGLITSTIAFIFITKNINMKNVLIAFLFLCLSLNIYQVNIGFFVIYSLTYILVEKEATLNRISIKKSVVVIIIGFIASLVNIFTLNILQKYNIVQATERNANLNMNSIIKNFEFLFTKGQYEIWFKGSGFMPRGSILIFGAILCISLLVEISKKRMNLNSKIYILLLFVANYGIIFAPHLITSQIWLAPRTLVGFFAFLSSIILIIVMINVESRITNLLVASTCIFLLISIFQIQTIASDNFANNKIDREYATLICQKISEYEKKNNVKITNISTKLDTSPTYGYYGNVEYIGYDTNIRALVVPWADVNLINYVSGRNFNKIDMKDDIYNKYFKDKNWNYFDLDEQLIFSGDTAYLIMY